MTTGRWPSREHWQAEPLLWDSFAWQRRYRRASLYATPEELAAILAALRAERRARGRGARGAPAWSRKRRLTNAIKCLEQLDRIPLAYHEGGDSPALGELRRRCAAAEAAARQAAEAEHRAWRQSEEGWQAELKRRAEREAYLAGPSSALLPRRGP